MWAWCVVCGVRGAGCGVWGAGCGVSGVGYSAWDRCGVQGGRLLEGGADIAANGVVLGAERL